MNTSLQNLGEVLGQLDHTVKKEFELNRRILSFDEFLLTLAESPKRALRGSAQYAVDMMDHFQTEGSDTSRRFKVFDLPVEGKTPRVIGHERVQNHLYRAFKAFARSGINNKLLLLHGPNGSAKTSLVHALMEGLERYSHTPEGAQYRINWIFPVERYTKPSMGLGVKERSSSDPYRKTHLDSYARLPDEEVASRISCDLKDHPILLIPTSLRRGFLEKLLGPSQVESIWQGLPLYLKNGDLSHQSKLIFDALLTAYQGDFKKVLMHVQVERLYLSRRYREGLVTIEPQMHVDAHFQQLTVNRGVGALPSALQGLNFFSLGGDLVAANRGLVEFSDLLKRPVDSFKYLLSACESGAVNIGNSIAYLDQLMLGSTNEVQLDAFKEFPDFMSFKARIELIRVPYLLETSKERMVYHYQLPQMAGEKAVTPHTDSMTALWAVLTRLKKPNSIHYPPNVSTLIANLTPLEKARLYDSGEMPAHLTPEDRKVLKAAIPRLREEYDNVPYYEGRLGASAREIKTILYEAAQNNEFATLSPLAVFKQLEDFVKKVSEYDFLKQDVKDGYHDCSEFIQIVRNEYLNVIDREVRDSIGLYDSRQWEDFLKKYVQQISLVLKKEKQKNPITGALEDPDFALISEFEKIVEAPQSDTERDAFRNNVIAQVGAWALDHPKAPVIYSKVFPEYWKKLEKFYFESQKSLLTKMHDALIMYRSGSDTLDKGASDSEGAQLARKTVASMVSNLGYTEEGAKEVITFLMKNRY